MARYVLRAKASGGPPRPPAMAPSYVGATARPRGAKRNRSASGASAGREVPFYTLEPPMRPQGEVGWAGREPFVPDDLFAGSADHREAGPLPLPRPEVRADKLPGEDIFGPGVNRTFLATPQWRLAGRDGWPSNCVGPESPFWPGVCAACFEAPRPAARPTPPTFPFPLSALPHRA
jgi:hypothetical protein